MVRVAVEVPAPSASCCATQSTAFVSFTGSWVRLRPSARVRVAKCSRRTAFELSPKRRAASLRMVGGADACDQDVDDDVFDDDASSEEDSTFVLEETDLSDPTAVAPSARPVVVHAPAVGVADVVLVGVIMAVVYGLASTSHRVFFSSTPYTALVIDTSLGVLPSYAMQSVTRLLAAYIVSLVFSLGYAYVAYRVPFAAKTLMLVRVTCVLRPNRAVPCIIDRRALSEPMSNLV
jgi:hypothetical protein